MIDPDTLATEDPVTRRDSEKRCNIRCETVNMAGSYMRRPTPDGCWHTCMCTCPAPIKKRRCKQKCKKQGFGHIWHRRAQYAGDLGSYPEAPFQCKHVCECVGKFQGQLGKRDPEDASRAASEAELRSGDHPAKKKRNEVR